MTTWTDRLPTAFPKVLLAEANQLAAIIDPDTGGALTFSAGNTRGGYVYAEIPLMAHFMSVVQERDPDTWRTVIASLADKKGVERLAPEVIDALCAAMLFGANECAVLGSASG